MDDFELIMEEESRKEKKERAIKQYLEAEQMHGKDHYLTQLRKQLLQVILWAQQMNETVATIRSIYKTISEFDSQIDELGQMSMGDDSYLKKIEKYPLKIQEMLLPYYQKKELKKARKKLQPLVFRMKGVAMRMQAFSENSQKMIEILNGVMNPDLKGKSAPIQNTEMERIFSQEVEGYKAAHGMSTSSSVTKSKTTGSSGKPGDDDDDIL